MDRPASVEGLVVAGWVDGQGAEEELALLGHNPDLSASREDVDGFVLVSGANAESCRCGHDGRGTEGSELSRGSGLDPGSEGLGGGGPIEGAVGP